MKFLVFSHDYALICLPRFMPLWQPVLSAVTRRARYVEVRHLPLLLKALDHAGGGQDEHLLDAMTARMLEALPVDTSTLQIDGISQPQFTLEVDSG